MSLYRETVVEVYRRMRNIRCFEEKLFEPVGTGWMGGFDWCLAVS